MNYWNGIHIGNVTCGPRTKWGVHKIITDVNGVSIVRILDPEGIGSIIDEFATVLKLTKTGTVRLRCRGYEYTAYSFMSGETPYTAGSEYEMNELCDRWMVYYSWWNIMLKKEDMYCRGTTDRSIVIYPSTGYKLENITTKYSIVMPECMNKCIDLASWLGVYNECDINILLNKLRHSLEEIIQRINPELISLSNIVTSRIRNFLFFFLIKE